MKTKHFYAAPVAAPAQEQFAVDMPAYVAVPGSQPFGPFPLAVCLLRGLELAKTASPFTISSEEGTTLLALDNLHVHGETRLVQVFMHQIELAKLFFQ